MALCDSCGFGAVYTVPVTVYLCEKAWLCLIGSSGIGDLQVNGAVEFTLHSSCQWLHLPLQMQIQERPCFVCLPLMLLLWLGATFLYAVFLYMFFKWLSCLFISGISFLFSVFFFFYSSCNLSTVHFLHNSHCRQTCHDHVTKWKRRNKTSTTNQSQKKRIPNWCKNCLT